MWGCALKPNLAAFPARSTMRAKPAVLNGAPRSLVNMKGDLGCCSAQAMPVSDQDHGGVAMAMAVALGGVAQALDFGVGQMLAAAVGCVGPPTRRDCSIFGAWSDQLELGFCHGFQSSLKSDCQYNDRYPNS
jgi:hypothetical protein